MGLGGQEDDIVRSNFILTPKKLVHKIVAAQIGSLMQKKKYIYIYIILIYVVEIIIVFISIVVDIKQYVNSESTAKLFLNSRGALSL